MKRIIAFVVVLGASLTGALLAQLRAEDALPREQRPDPIVGYWSFFANNVTEVRKDGELRSSLGLGGKWECISAKEPERKYKFVWENGRYGGTLTLSRDHQKLSGTNQGGKAVTATRLKKQVE